MKNIIVIVGPTGSGKTELGLQIAKKINGEIISADSRQVYKHLDIGTNKEGIWDKNKNLRFLDEIPQHLTDIIDPSETYNAGEFAKSASQLIESIQQKNKAPVIVGGTGLYIKALIDGLAELPERNEKIRDKLNAQLKKHGKEYLYEKLSKVDPESAENNRHNPQRLIRALEVYEITKVPISLLQKNTTPSKHSFTQFGMNWEKEDLYHRLNARCIDMLNLGMINETKKVIEMGYPKNSPGLQGLGYKHIVHHLEKKIPIKEIIEIFQQDTRRYAKRQMTWFKRDKRIKWLSGKNPEINVEEVLKNLI